MSDIYSIKAKRINGEEADLSEFSEKVLLIVNTASECGFTKQYDGLEQLQQQFGHEKFNVLGFPCDQFGHQEPGDDEQIANFCTSRFSVTFPMFSKIEVNGQKTHPLYLLLKKQAKGVLGTESIKWNFTKFLVNKNGEVVKRFAPTDKPESIAKEIQKLMS